MKLRPYQEEAKEAVLTEWAVGHKKTLLVLPTGCHAIGEKVLMSNGSSINVENIDIGDRLMGSDGTYRTVLIRHEGESELYEITPVKGKPFIVTKDHKLTLVRTNEKSRKKYPSDFLGGSLVDVTVEEWLGWSKNKKHIHKLIRSSAIDEFDTENELIIDPYFLGVLLGDGDLVNSLSVTTMDDAIVEEIEEQCEAYDMTYRTEPAGKAKTYIFQSGKLGMRGGKLHQELSQLNLRRVGSRGKFVPTEYKTAPIKERLEMIAGLLDTDGSYRDGGYDFISASKQLSEDLAFMCRSVGLAAYVTESVKKAQNNFEGTYYRVSISGDCSIIPMRVEHKKPLPRKQIKNVLRTGFSVKSVGVGNYVGFTVDGDNRYLMDDFTITHNCGKTIVFSKVIEECVRRGERVLVLAHRGELLDQAADKLEQATGLSTSKEKAEETSVGSWSRVVVGSVQSMSQAKRLSRFKPDHFDAIIVDEAHHILSATYQTVLKHFSEANVLGVTATPDRGDMQNLGQFFESLAYEYTLPKAIKEGFLSPIKALTLPIKLDLSEVRQTAGDFNAKQLGNVLDPYLEAIADEMVQHASTRKTVVFLPLVKTSQKFRDILNEKGFRAAEVNGNSKDREQVLEDFENDKYNVLCNSMLLTEGWDSPAVDCIVVLRPTRVRSLYSQMVGRGTRLFPGKEEVLLLDFLWHTDRHELVHPAHLIAEDAQVAKKATEKIEEAGMPVDIEEILVEAQEDVTNDREEALAKQLELLKRRKKKLVDPIQYEMLLQDKDLSNYVPMFGQELDPPTKEQKDEIEKAGIDPTNIDSKGKADELIKRIQERNQKNLTTAKQIRQLEQRGYQNVANWTFDQARVLINQLAANNWRTVHRVPQAYVPS